jgi:hypothetical protein
LRLFLHTPPFRGFLDYPYSFWACSAFLAMVQKPKRWSRHRFPDSSAVRACQRGGYRDSPINNLGDLLLAYNYFCIKCDRIPSFLAQFGWQVDDHRPQMAPKGQAPKGKERRWGRGGLGGGASVNEGARGSLGNPPVANGAILKLAPLPQRKIVGIRVFGSQPASFFAASGAGPRRL